MDEATRDQVIKIIDSVNDMTIATVREDGYPQATTVSYVNDGLAIYFGTAADSQKARNLAKNNKVSLTINRDYDSWDEIEGVSISGVATSVADPEDQKKVQRLLLAKFPQIADYVPADMPQEELALFRVDPEVISLLDYRKGFGHTETIRI